MSIIKKNTEKYVPIVIQFENHMYMGFVTEKEANSYEMPITYLKFMGTRSGYPMTEREDPVLDDLVYKMSLGLYFKLSCELKENGKKYNIKKFKHELNNR
jgi:hypothetical protein